MSEKKGEIVTFEKWIAREFSDSTIDALKTNQYINLGTMKHLVQYIFDNAYCPKFVELVKLNLSTDTSKSEDDEILKLKNKNINLDKRLDKLKQEWQKQEDDIEAIMRNLNEFEEITDVNNEKNRISNIDNQIKESFLKKAQETVNNFDFASKKLTTITNIIDMNSSGGMKKHELEKILMQFQKQIKTDLNLTNTESKMNINFNEVNLKEVLSLLNSLINEEVDNITQIMSDFKIKNEIDLIKYRLESTRLNDNCQNETTIDELNKLNLNFVEKQCEIIKMIKDRESYDSQRRRIAGLIAQHSDKQHLIEYYKAYIMFKRSELNFNELEKFLNEIQIQIGECIKQDEKRNEKLEKLNELKSKINKNQTLIQSIIEKNLKSFDNSLELQDQIEEQIQLMPEQLKSLNLTQSTIVDDYLLHDFEYYKEKLKQSRTPLFNANNLSSHATDLVLLYDLLNYPKYKLRFYMFDELVSLMNRLNEQKSNKYMNISHCANECTYLNNILEESKSIDQTNIMKYFDALTERINRCDQYTSNFSSQIKLVNDWWSQPAISECIFNNLTVNGRTIDYYSKLIDECIGNNTIKNQK